MNTHQRWAQKMMRNEGRPIRDIEKEAADLERRRIRRAQRAALLDLFAEACRLAVEDNAVGRALPLTAIHDIIDAATRAKKGKRT